MGYEVRRVRGDWIHPRNPETGRFIPLFDGSQYPATLAAFKQHLEEFGVEQTIEDWGAEPGAEEFMPVWTEAEKTHWMMYSTISEGIPISPAFPTPEGLAQWLSHHRGDERFSYEENYQSWLRVVNGGYAPSVVITGGGAYSGVFIDAIAGVETNA